VAGTWVFTRGSDRLEVRRCEGGLIVTGVGHHREHWFNTTESLVVFQGELEAQLVALGWYLDAYHPEPDPEEASRRRLLFFRRRPAATQE
jgi:hypothetical protein